MNPRYSLLMVAFLLVLTAPAALAQTEPDAPAPPRANPEDVASVDAIITAIYDVISGPANHPRDWDRFRSLVDRQHRLAAGMAGPAHPRALPLGWRVRQMGKRQMGK